VEERPAKPRVSLDHKRMTLTVRPCSSDTNRADVIHQWHMTLLHEAVPPLIRKSASKSTATSCNA
jgi:hypothetical protein